MDDNILVIGIAGGTGSGKTTLMNNLISRFEGMVTVISHDNYYKRHDDMTYEERSQLNYDEPAAFDTSLMVYRHQPDGLPSGRTAPGTRHRMPGVRLYHP